MSIYLQSVPRFYYGVALKKNDQRIKKNIERIMRSISIKPADHQRELLKVLLDIEIPEEYIAFLFDLSLMLWKRYP
jgi:hypothetical protein